MTLDLVAGVVAEMTIPARLLEAFRVLDAAHLGEDVGRYAMDVNTARRIVQAAAGE